MKLANADASAPTGSASASASATASASAPARSDTQALKRVAQRAQQQMEEALAAKEAEHVAYLQQALDYLKAEHQIGFAFTTVKDLLNGSKLKITDKNGTVWRKASEPRSAGRLRHGDVLLR